MSAKAIREASGKGLINRLLPDGTAAANCRFASVDEHTKMSQLTTDHPWLLTEKLVVKPDQLIKRRGKLGMDKMIIFIQRPFEPFLFFWSVFDHFFQFMRFLLIFVAFLLVIPIF